MGGGRGIEEWGDKNEVGEVRVWAKGCGVRNEKCRVRRRGSIESKGWGVGNILCWVWRIGGVKSDGLGVEADGQRMFWRGFSVGWGLRGEWWGVQS